MEAANDHVVTYCDVTTFTTLKSYSPTYRGWRHVVYLQYIYTSIQQPKTAQTLALNPQNLYQNTIFKIIADASIFKGKGLVFDPAELSFTDARLWQFKIGLAQINYIPNS